MPPLNLKIFLGLVVCLAVLAAINVFLPQGSLVPAETLPASKPVMALAVAAIMLVVYGGLGYLGLVLSRRLGFAEIWPATISLKQKLLIPALVGAILGVFFILVDAIAGRFHTLGPIPHPPFPTSLVASASAGIGEELIFRLFFISLWVWLVSEIILKKKWKGRVFWIVAVASAIAFALAHLPSIMFLFGMKSIGDVPIALMGEILLLNGFLSIVAAYYFKKYGILSAMGIHFWTDMVWHVIWGAF